MDRCLGRPLPHQLANPTRANPMAINLSLNQSPGVCGISGRFQPLSPTIGHVPTRYSPVRRSPHTPKICFSLDLHVLGLPPAFVLSQDQTLKLIRVNQCQKTSAKLHAKRSPLPQTLEKPDGPRTIKSSKPIGTSWPANADTNPSNQPTFCVTYVKENQDKTPYNKRRPRLPSHQSNCQRTNVRRPARPAPFGGP